MSFVVEVIPRDGRHARWRDLKSEVRAEKMLPFGPDVTDDGPVGMAALKGVPVSVAESTYDPESYLTDYPRTVSDLPARWSDGFVYGIDGRSAEGRRVAGEFVVALAEAVDGMIAIPDDEFGLVPGGLYTVDEFKRYLAG